MNIWNTVFLVLILLLAAACGFLAYQESTIRKQWQQGVASVEKKIPELQKQAADLRNGKAPTKKTDEKTFEEMSVAERETKVNVLVFERKMAWFGCQPGNIDSESEKVEPEPLDGGKPTTTPDQLKPLRLPKVKMTISEPKDKDGKVLKPEGLEGIVYLFDEGQEQVGGSFLGRFRVTQPVEETPQGDYQATLVSLDEMTEDEVEQLKKSARSTWAVYLAAPMDRHEGIFDNMTPDELDTLIPRKGVRERFENKDRQLQDFDILLTSALQRRRQLWWDRDETKRQTVKMEESAETSKKEEEALRQDIDLAKTQADEMKSQGDAVVDKLQNLDKMIDDIEKKIKYEQQRSEWFIERIAEYQLQVAELIEQKAEEAAK